MLGVGGKEQLAEGTQVTRSKGCTSAALLARCTARRQHVSLAQHALVPRKTPSASSSGINGPLYYYLEG